MSSQAKVRINRDPIKRVSFHTVSSDYRWSYGEHTHSEYCEIVTCRKGSFKHTLNGKVTEHKAGTIVFIREKDIHSIEGGSFVFSNVMFNLLWFKRLEQFLDRPGFLDELLNAPDPPSVSLKADQWKRYLGVLNRLMKQFDNELSHILFAEYFLLAFGELLQTSLADREYGEDMPDWLSETIHWASRNRDRQIKLFDLIDRSHKCHEHLSRSFKKYLGMSPSSWLKQEQLLRAAELLAVTNYPILQVCYRAGFENPSYFHQRFKKHYKVTPANYRKKHFRGST
ncbi:MAG: AraC family transcriptional regulator [Planctomycetota bacterium]|jgi:AraC family cel operon transcriptional repressor